VKVSTEVARKFRGNPEKALGYQERTSKQFAKITEIELKKAHDRMRLSGLKKRGLSTEDYDGSSKRKDEPREKNDGKREDEDEDEEEYEDEGEDEDEESYGNEKEKNGEDAGKQQEVQDDQESDKSESSEESENQTKALRSTKTRVMTTLKLTRTSSLL